MRVMKILCCDGRTARLSALTALVFFAALYFLTSHFPKTYFTGASIPELKSWSNALVTTTEKPLWPYRTFKSSSWKPPHLNITRHAGDLAEGYLLVTAKNRGHEGLVQSAPWIFDDEGELVYAHDSEYGVNNFRVQTYEGAEYLTVWQGESTIGHGYGELVMLDGEYRQTQVGLMLNGTFDMAKIASRDPPDLIDFHEQELSSRGTVYVTAYNNTPADLTSIGGQKDGWAVDSLLYEIDIRSGEVLFTWSALQHIPLEASHLELKTYMGTGINGAAWDHFHLNSIHEVGGYLLVSSRHAFAVYLIDRKTGEIAWELSGRGEGGDFGALGGEGQFSWQHDARAHNVTKDSMTISLFDNHVMPELDRSTPTRGLLLQISLPPNPSEPPTVLRNVHADEVLYSPSQGSYDPALSNGNQLLCYGPTPVAREFGPDGDLRWEGRFGIDDAVQSYRAFKQMWRGTPRDWDPSLHVELVKKEDSDGEELELYVSWNGATEVTSWNIYIKKGKTSKLNQLGTAKRMGFETIARVGGGKGDCIVVGAVEGEREVRRSNELCMK